VSRTGEQGLDTYKPDDKVSLGFKAGVAYNIGNPNTVNGDALLEMNFQSTGGIKNIRLYGSAHIMAKIEKKDLLTRVNDIYKKAQAKLDKLSDSFSDKLPNNMSGSDVAKRVYPEEEPSTGVNAYLTLDYDFPTKTFDADFMLMVSIMGNFIRGVGNNNEAGGGKLHISPQTWYIYAGTPTNPIGLEIGLGSLSLTTKSYLMLGDISEKPPLPPRQVLDILRITPEQADYMKYPDMMQTGKGIAFGANLSFDTGNLTFLILYARFMAGVGIDFMLRDMSGYACEGKTDPIGINGWYANGQCWAYLQGDLGAKIKINIGIVKINKKVTVIKGATAALLQAKFPNPTWIGGYLAVHLNVLGIINVDMKFKMSFGDDCKLVNINGDNSPVDLPIIADLSPYDKDEDIDVFVNPQATFNIPAGQTIEVEDDNGNSKSYRAKLEDFYVMDNRNQKVTGQIKWNAAKNAVTFEPKDALPGPADMKAYVSVTFEEFTGGRWQTVMYNGNPSRETKESAFKTGERPNYIPLTNIEYCYPVINQKNLYKNEFTAGYVQLKKGQPYLFPANFQYQAVFTAKDGTAVSSAFKYDVSKMRLDYSLPSIVNRTDYALSFVASNLPSASTPQTPAVKTDNVQLTDGEGESFSVDYMQQAAQKIIQDGSLEVLKYSLKTSRYNSFAQKLSDSQLEPTNRYINSEVRDLLMINKGEIELFDEAELVGTGYTAGVPLLSVEAALDNDYYLKDIAPLVYNGYPVQGLTITKRDAKEYGVPPTRALPLYDGYLNYIAGNTYDDFLSRMFPYVYELPYYYCIDYYDLQTRAVNSFDKKGINMAPLMPLIESHFLFIRQGNYRVNFKYTLPGGKVSSTTPFNYVNTLDWR
jgi:hypothetical protein